MNARSTHWLPPAALCFLAIAAAAHAAPPAARRTDPIDAHASVPPVAYVSSLSRPRANADEPAIAWREANDTAARIGGWRAYAREAQQPAATPAATPAAASAAPARPNPPAVKAPPAPTGHGGHKMP